MPCNIYWSFPLTQTPKEIQVPDNNIKSFLQRYVPFSDIHSSLPSTPFLLFSTITGIHNARPTHIQSLPPRLTLSRPLLPCRCSSVHSLAAALLVCQGRVRGFSPPASPRLAGLQVTLGRPAGSGSSYHLAPALPPFLPLSLPPSIPPSFLNAALPQ